MSSDVTENTATPMPSLDGAESIVPDQVQVSPMEMGVGEGLVSALANLDAAVPSAQWGIVEASDSLQGAHTDGADLSVAAFAPADDMSDVGAVIDGDMMASLVPDLDALTTEADLFNISSPIDFDFSSDT